jgi:hypothetical protein
VAGGIAIAVIAIAFAGYLLFMLARHLIRRRGRK